MSKKLTIGLFTLLFAVSGMQSLAISKISKSQDLDNLNVASVINSKDDKSLTVATQEKDNILLEQYLKNKYPKDYEQRLVRINSKIKNLFLANGVNDNDDLAQKNIFHRILCGIMGGNYYQEYMGGGAYCARMNIGLPYIIDNFEDNNIFLNEKSGIKNTTSAEYLKNVSVSEVQKITTLSDGIQEILEEEGVYINALGGPGFRRFLCRLFGGTWAEGVSEIGEATVWVQSCLW